MHLSWRRKYYVRPQQRVKEVHAYHHILLTFITGALIGWILAFVTLVFIPLMMRDRQARRLPVRDDPYTTLLANTSSDPWGDGPDRAPGPKRVFCLVLVTDSKRRLEQVRAVKDTWGSECDGLEFATDRRLPSNFPSFAPALVPGGKLVNVTRAQYRVIQLAFKRERFSKNKFDFYFLAPDSVFVAMCHLRLLVARAAADRPLAWGLLTQSFVPGSGRVAHLSGRAGILLSEGARRALVAADCGSPRLPADTQLSLCLRRLGAPLRHVSGFHAAPVEHCAYAPPPPPPPRGLMHRMSRWAGGQSATRHWRPCAPRAVTFGEMHFAVIRKVYFFMNLGLYGITGVMHDGLAG